MKLLTKCRKCFHVLDVDASINGNSMEFMVFPCPNCHPAKPEMVTPKAGEWIDVRNLNMAPTAFNRRIADGTRHKTGVKAKDANCYEGVPYELWRYPGETEWRD